MQKTINAMNAFWSGKKAAVTVSEHYDDYEIGKIDHSHGKGDNVSCNHPDQNCG